MVQGGVPASNIIHIPQSINTELAESSSSGYPVPGRRKFNFLSVFAWQQRKGWDLLLLAFLEAFGSNQEVSLVIKASPFQGGNIGEATIREELEECFKRLCARHKCLTPVKEEAKEEASGWMYTEHQPSNVLVLFKDLNTTEVGSLYGNADAFVLPSRSEGWGRPYMEAMLHGLPVIGTRFGGQLDFMNQNNSFLIDYNLSALSPHAQKEYKLNVVVDISGHRWAEPNVNHLRELMLLVVHNTTLASARGRQARLDIQRHYAPEHIGRSVQRRVQHIATRRMVCPCDNAPCNYRVEATAFLQRGRHVAALACLREHLRVSAAERKQWTKVEQIPDANLLIDFGYALYYLNRVVSASRALKQALVLDDSIGRAHCIYALCISRAATNAGEAASLAFLRQRKHSQDGNLYVKEAFARARDCVRMSPEVPEAARLRPLL